LGVSSEPTLLASVMNFTKIEHTVFSLPLLFSGAWLGAGRRWPGWSGLVLIALAGVGARCLGMAMNRILDRDLDAKNKRTANRELPSGRISLGGAWAIAGAGLGAYLLACWALGPLCLMLSAVPAVPLIAYSLLKRFTNLCHFGIGLCLALAPLGAFVAASNSLAMNLEVVLLALFAFCWISGADIVYALMDIDSDRKTGVHSIPASLGAGGAQVVAAGVHVAAIGCLAGLWMALGAGAGPCAAVVVSAIAFCAGYVQRIPVGVRFFPIFAIAGLAGSLVPLLGAAR
jgi:4-hydroxybenzoate polyprenyltransferase